MAEENAAYGLGGGMAISRPIIFLGMLPGGADKRTQREIRGIMQLVEPLEDRCQLVSATDDQGTGLLAQLEAYQFAENVVILHLCGKQTDQLTEDFEARLLTQLDRLPGLKVIFLSGNASFEWLDYLLSRDIPLIMTLEERKGSGFTTSITRLFYTSLLQGANLMEAIDRIKQDYGHRFFSHVVRYDIDTNAFEWPGRSRQEQQGKISWGAYSLADRIPHWRWRLVPIIDIPPEDPLLTIRNRSLSILSGSLGLGLAILVGRLIWMSLGG